MKFAFQMHAVRNYYRMAEPSVAQQSALFDWAAREGFDGIDVPDSWSFDGVDRAIAADVWRRAHERGLEVGSLNCMGKSLCHPQFGEQNARALARSVDVAAWLQCRVVNISLAPPRVMSQPPLTGLRETPHGSRTATEADFEITIERLRGLARYAQGLGVELSIELHDRGLADTSANVLRIVREAGERNVGANPDLCNGYRAYDIAPETRQEALTALAPYANLWHVNNVCRIHFPQEQRAVFVETPLDQGDIDYRWALGQMRLAGFDGWVVVEHKGTGDPFEMMAHGRRYLARLFESNFSIPA